jgi:hypothetical protein
MTLRDATAMRVVLKFRSLWRFVRIKAPRASRVLSDADNDDMVFQVRSEEKKLLERKAPPASSSRNAGERAN